MNRHLLILLFVAALAGCASLERTEPPAPIVSATTPAAEPAQTRPAATPPPEETVEVYAYRPPASAPDAGTGPDEIPARDAVPEGDGPISESAATGPAGTAPYEVESGPRASTSIPPDTVPAPAPEVVAFAPPPPPPNLPPAADGLVKQAEQQRQAKDYVSAAATLERALGIRPQEPYIWNRLARVRTDQGLYAQAGNLASRSNALAGDQAALKQDNWGMIAIARRATGDTAGALEAERKARGG